MARSKSPYDFLKEHIRGIYFPLHYGKPRQEEIDNLITLNNELRRIAVNFNQSVRALNTYRANGEPVPPELIQKITEELAAFHQTRLKIDDLLEAYYGKK